MFNYWDCHVESDYTESKSKLNTRELIFCEECEFLRCGVANPADYKCGHPENIIHTRDWRRRSKTYVTYRHSPWVKNRSNDCTFFVKKNTKNISKYK